MVDGRTPAAKRLVLLLTIALLGMLVGRSPAGSGSEGQEPVARHVLALYDGGAGSQSLGIEDPVHQLYELPLNYLGMVVLRHDVRDGPPPARLLTDLRAVLTAFEYTDDPVEWLWPWLEARRREGGIRFVHFGEWGPLRFVNRRENTGRLARWLASFGLGFDPAYVDIPLGVKVTLSDRLPCAIEADPTGHSIHRGPWIESGANTAWISTRSSADPGRARTPIVTGPWGGIALAPYVYREGAGEGGRRLYLDLFAFLRTALGLTGVPAPQPCVINGRRMFFCHVDGDGFESLSTIRRGANCGEVFLDEIIEKYELPFTVSIIANSITDDLKPTVRTPMIEAASRLLRHPRVEAASHSVRHPLNWGMVGESPERSSATFVFPGPKHFDKTLVGEVRDSIRFINDYLLPPTKRCEVMLWSGNACPQVDAIAEADRLGLLNLNGGIYRWDALNDSVSYVPPLGRIVNGHVQVYCGSSNEVVYDGYFTTNPLSFRHVDTTIERTGRGKILKPANVYVHLFSVERRGRIRVFRRLLDRWGKSEPTAPVFASTYIRSVRSALGTARILRTPNGWAFRDFGDCRTVRLDDPAGEIDWSRSPGILGARVLQGSLHLHLAKPDAEVTLVKKATPAPHVLEANHVLTKASRDATGVAVTSTSLAPRLIVFAGFPPDGPLILRLDSVQQEVAADENGEFRLELPPAGPNRVEVRRP